MFFFFLITNEGIMKIDEILPCAFLSGQCAIVSSLQDRANLFDNWKRPTLCLVCWLSCLNGAEVF